jgi:hypothetical protein
VSSRGKLICPMIWNNAYRGGDMGFELAGTYVGHCDCTHICPCAVDEPPTGPKGQCHGLMVLHIAHGALDDTDLSDTKVVLGYSSPGKISDGGLRLGLVVDNAASDEQGACSVSPSTRTMAKQHSSRGQARSRTAVCRRSPRRRS